jgi:hypothetical protein
VTLGFALAVLAIMSSFGWLRPLLGHLTHAISRVLDAMSDLTSSNSGNGKRGSD